MSIPSIDAKEQINGTTTITFLERLVQPFVTRIRRRPYLILKRLVYIIFSIRFDHKIACLAKSDDVRAD